MARRVPVLGQHHVLEGLGDFVDQRDDLVALGDREAAAGQEAVLHVDDDERRIRAGLDLALRQRARSAMGRARPATGHRRRRATSGAIHRCMAKLLRHDCCCPQLRPGPARRKRYHPVGFPCGPGGSAVERGGRMPLHLIKLCVGCDSIEDLASWQAERLRARRRAGEKKPRLFHRTFQTPKRRGRAARRRLALLGDQGPRAGAPAARSISPRAPRTMARPAAC